MKKNIIKKTLTILLLVLIAGILLVPKKIFTNEEFLTGKTSQTLYSTRYKNNYKEFDKNQLDPTFMNSIDDSNYELIMKRCYQFPGVTIEEMIKRMNQQVNDPTSRFIGQRGFTLITNNFTDVKNKIIADIQTVHDTKIKAPINGNLYTLLFQVPYYKDAQGEDIIIQSFNINSYNFLPSYSADPRNMNGQQQIYYVVWMFYGNYNSKWKIQNQDNFPQLWMSWLDANNISYEPQCFMVGAGNTDGPVKYAGCSSSKGTINGVASATCAGPKAGNNLLQTDNKDPKTTTSSYGILYTVNKTASSIAPYFSNPSFKVSPLPEQQQSLHLHTNSVTDLDYSNHTNHTNHMNHKNNKKKRANIK
jgi:hypothetical protein